MPKVYVICGGGINWHWWYVLNGVEYYFYPAQPNAQEFCLPYYSPERRTIRVVPHRTLYLPNELIKGW